MDVVPLLILYCFISSNANSTARQVGVYWSRRHYAEDTGGCTLISVCLPHPRRPSVPTKLPHTTLEACQGGLLMRTQCMSCPCRCISSEMYRLLVTLRCSSAPLGAGTQVLMLVGPRVLAADQRGPHSVALRARRALEATRIDGRSRPEQSRRAYEVRAHRRPPEGSRAPPLAKAKESGTALLRISKGRGPRGL